jgi:signal transduction histidine kinase
VTGTLTSKDRVALFDKLQAVAGDPLRADINGTYAVAASATTLWRIPLSNTAGVVSERAQKLTARVQDEQRQWEIITVGAVLLAVVMLWLANKWITRPLRSLAQQAGVMAGERLPSAVQTILRSGHDEVDRPEITPVRVRAGGEVRDVAAALNRVQDSAVELALEQARLRGSVADAFVNLGRRNQNLLSRQLEFISQLEAHESDPETLEHLFKLDHLATRMRRNAESLLVLAGHEPPRTWSAPVAIGDVVRGALGEVEGYQRVRLRHLDDARVDGAVAVDVSHVVAELVENALSFSPPDTDVEVYGRRDEFGYILTIVDQGIGIPPDELDHANELISSTDPGTFGPSRFLGHYVVAQLAARHGLGVHLAASPAGGITAMVALPAVLLGEHAPPADMAFDAVVAGALGGTPPEARPPEVLGTGAADSGERPATALPRREGASPVASESARVVAPESSFDPVDFAAAVLHPAAEVLPSHGTPADRAPEAAQTRREDSFEEALARFELGARLAGPRGDSPNESPTAGDSFDESPTFADSLDELPAATSRALGESSARGDSFDDSLTRFGADTGDATPGPPTPSVPAAGAAPDAPHAPPTPERPRVGIGTFADLRAVATPPRPTTPPASPAPPANAPLASAGARPAAPDAPRVPPTSPTATTASSAFAALHEATPPHEYDAEADGLGAADAMRLAAVFSEDFLPQKLPKRGRRSGRLGAPWSREKPAKSATAPAPPGPERAVERVETPNPLAPAVSSAHARVVDPTAGSARHSDGGLRFGPGGPALDASERSATAASFASGMTDAIDAIDATRPPAAPSAPASEGDQRFAFFAAFRAAAERAREEAGIDDRRMGK